MTTTAPPDRRIIVGIGVGVLILAALLVLGVLFLTPKIFGGEGAAPAQSATASVVETEEPVEPTAVYDEQMAAKEACDAGFVQYTAPSGAVYICPAVAGMVAPTVAEAPTPTEQASVPATGDEAHWQRLRELDPVFRSSGLEAWLSAAGLTWDNLVADARQVEEETSPLSEVLVSGLQVDVVNLVVNWPNCVTTDDPSEVTVGQTTRQHRPDMRNPSVIYTNVAATGTVTVWTDCSNWEQLLPPE